MLIVWGVCTTRLVNARAEGYTTANVWLDTHSRYNSVEVRPEETVIDEGEGNRTERLETP